MNRQHYYKPMLALAAQKAFTDKDWIFEIKWDGFRAIAYVEKQFRLRSRNGKELKGNFPELAQLTQLGANIVVDGEIVVMQDGKPDFQALLERGQSVSAGEIQRQAMRAPAIYIVFDILEKEGIPITQLPLTERKKILAQSLKEGTNVVISDYIEGQGEAYFQLTLEKGLEGIVAKKKDSLYQPGRRSQDWLKVKATQSGDFIITGYTAGEGNRSEFLGALLLGYLDNNNTLIYAGHVGTGFNEQTLSDIKQRLDRLRTDRSPFKEIPDTNGKATWVRPELVAEVKYSQWTRDGRLRAPVFIRLREDKPVTEVRRDNIIPAPAANISNKTDEEIEGLLEQLKSRKDKFIIKVEGNEINISHLDKILWPPTKNHPALTKLDFMNYLARVSPYFLPHLKDRPLTLSRYPDGITGEHFWQRHLNHEIPDFITTVNVPDEAGKSGQYLICDNLSTLIWLGQAADIEFHTWFSRTTIGPDMTEKGDNASRILDYPDFIIFDLDPYIYSGKEATGDEPELNRDAFMKTCEVAKWLKEILDGLSLTPFLKTSGKTGLHLYVPIVRELDYGAVRRVAETIGHYVLRKHPEEITMEWSTEKRRGKIFIDYGQNVRGKTLASVYSPRPDIQACVSFPLRWEELGKSYPTDYTIVTVPDLLDKHGDLWSGIIGSKRSIKVNLNQVEKN